MIKFDKIYNPYLPIGFLLDRQEVTGSNPVLPTSVIWVKCIDKILSTLHKLSTNCTFLAVFCLFRILATPPLHCCTIALEANAANFTRFFLL